MRRLTTAVAAVLAIPWILAGQDAPIPDAPASAPSTRPKNKAEEIAEKIEKQVEKVRGIELKTPVKIGVYDKATLKAFLLKSAEKELSPERLDPQVRALKALELIPADLDYKKLLLEMLNEQIAGFYDPETKELRLIDRSAAGAEPDDSDEMTKGMMAMMGVDVDSFIMAHELTHALQDQFIGLKRLPIDVQDDDDLAIASKALVEGDATAAMMAWMFVKRGSPSKLLFNPATAGLLDGALDPKSIPGAKTLMNAPEIMKQGLIFPYLEGLRFCLAIGMPEKSFAAIDRALKDPPLSSEQILHPAKFMGENPDYPMVVALPDLGTALGMTPVTTNTLGELGTRILLQEKKVGKAEAKTASEGWDGDRYVLYGSAPAAGKPKPPDVVVWASTWDSAADADEAEASLKAWLAAIHAGKASEASDVTSARFVREDGTIDAIARKGQDLFLIRAVPKDAVVPVLRKLFEETKKTERKKV
jgi:hypothetical protein